jgi:undecaprenyl-diphosphatase
VVQGLTEFLPVSSSGHLVITQKLFGFTSPPFLFDVVVHVATLLAIVIYFNKKIIRLDFSYIKLLVIGTIPAVLVGLLLNNVTVHLFNSLTVVGFGLLFTAILLLLTKGKMVKGKEEKINPVRAITIGVFQAVAIIPGISRSGSTVVGGVMSGLSKKDAFTFSFMLAIPAIIGALVLQLAGNGTYEQVSAGAMLVGFLSASITGVASLKLLDKVVRESKLNYFGYYCAILGIVLLTKF